MAGKNIVQNAPNIEKESIRVYRCENTESYKMLDSLDVRKLAKKTLVIDSVKGDFWGSKSKGGIPVPLRQKGGLIFLQGVGTEMSINRRGSL